MTWTVGWPTGNISVKNNKTPGQNNMAYIETTAQVDHYFDEGAGFDGHHKFIKMPVQASDVSPGANMDGAIYLKSDGTTVQGYYQNAINVYEFIPAYKSGTVSVTSTSTFTNITTVPANVYGDVYLFRKVDNGTAANSTALIQVGHFYSNNNTVHAFSNRIKQEDTSDAYLLELENDETTDLNIRVRRGDASSGTWEYRITYRTA
jgi:hypothetical protein